MQNKKGFKSEPLTSIKMEDSLSPTLHAKLSFPKNSVGKEAEFGAVRVGGQKLDDATRMMYFKLEEMRVQRDAASCKITALMQEVEEVDGQIAENREEMLSMMAEREKETRAVDKRTHSERIKAKEAEKVNLEDWRLDLLDDIDDLELTESHCSKGLLELQSQLGNELEQSVAVISEGFSEVGIEPEKHFGKFNLVGKDAGVLMSKRGQEFWTFVEAGFIKIAERRGDLSTEAKALLVEEIKTRYSKVRELYRVADAVFSILGKAGRVDDDDLDLLEVSAGVLGDCWIDIYGAASFAPLLHQAVLHALEQGRRLKAFASVSESQGETLHASENALDAQYGHSLNYEKLELLKDKFRVIKDSKVTKDILISLLEETARGPKTKIPSRQECRRQQGQQSERSC